MYRDRAKERRAKYGTDAIVPGWKKRFERERAKTVASDEVSDPQPIETYSNIDMYSVVHEKS